MACCCECSGLVSGLDSISWREKCEPLTLRFKGRHAERAFVQQRLKVTRGTTILAAAHLAFWPVLRMLAAVEIDVGRMMVSLSGIGLAATTITGHRFPLLTETASALLLSVAMIGEGYHWHASSFSQCELLANLIGLQAMVVGIHMCFSLRWIVMLLTAIAGLGAAAGNFAITEDKLEGTDMMNYGIKVSAFFFFFLTWGTRQVELLERKQHIIVLEEKTARVHTEHQLTLKTEGPRDERDASRKGHGMVRSSESTASSLPETTKTGKIFDSPHDCGTKMHNLRDIGQQEQWLIKDSELSIEPRVLGQGGFGIVCCGEFCGLPVAVKMPKRHSIELGSFWTELRVLRKVRHPNVVLFYGCCFLESIPSMLLVSEFCPGHQLTSVVSGAAIGVIRDVHRCELLNGLLNALHYLHTRSTAIVHGDVKPGNCLVEMKARPEPFGGPEHAWELHAKLLDFGLSRFCTTTAGSAGGTSRWAAPEIILNDSLRPNTSMDVFSMGRLVYYIVTGLLPLHNYMLQEISSCVDLAVEWPNESALEAALRDLADRCMDADPDKRPSIVETHLQMADALSGVKQVELGALCGSPDRKPWRETPLASLVVNIQNHLAVGQFIETLGDGSIATLETPRFASAEHPSLRESEPGASLIDSEPGSSQGTFRTNDVVQVEVPPSGTMQGPQAEIRHDLASDGQRDGTPRGNAHFAESAFKL